MSRARWRPGDPLTRTSSGLPSVTDRPRSTFWFGNVERTQRIAPASSRSRRSVSAVNATLDASGYRGPRISTGNLPTATPRPTRSSGSTSGGGRAAAAGAIQRLPRDQCERAQRQRPERRQPWRAPTTPTRRWRRACHSRRRRRSTNCGPSTPTAGSVRRSTTSSDRRALPVSRTSAPRLVADRPRHRRDPSDRHRDDSARVPFGEERIDLLYNRINNVPGALQAAGTFTTLANS